MAAADRKSGIVSICQREQGYAVITGSDGARYVATVGGYLSPGLHVTFAAATVKDGEPRASEVLVDEAQP